MMSYWADGPISVSVNEICKRAGVSKPGLYREFGSEDGLKRATLIAYQAIVLTQLQEILARDQPFDETLDDLITFIRQDRVASGLPNGCLYVEMCENRDHLGELTTEKIDLLRQQTLDHYANWIDRAKAKGQFKPDIPTQTAAFYINAQIGSAMKMQKQGDAINDISNFLKIAFSVFS